MTEAEFIKTEGINIEELLDIGSESDEDEDMGFYPSDYTLNKC